MIISIGTDIASSQRIADILARRGEAFAKRILTRAEYDEFQKRSDQAAFLTRRFAAKEAVAKALGTGIGRGLSFQHIAVQHDDFGAPLLLLTGFAEERFTAIGGCSHHISISDERDYAVAFVVFSA
ncbi:holo-[acyl-carrier protein] synthase [Sinobacterium caligoides]|uniref:Holo-[acyl-carrier-protein] synthase n=1 Tax=Sinobacterium caligoides TaxID=933926 RepID=A0A3N2DYG7_9GAMM|nr:holo-ACP synthase [Sinobacterium caligoides]ROS04712.1 holo-[acyl-carrier protein] synthase [Sinobacterium caligoides]